MHVGESVVVPVRYEHSGSPVVTDEIYGGRDVASAIGLLRIQGCVAGYDHYRNGLGTECVRECRCGVLDRIGSVSDYDTVMVLLEDILDAFDQ